MPCNCCPNERWAAIDLLRYNAIPAPYEPPPPLRGVTYRARRLVDAMPTPAGFPLDFYKWDSFIAYWWATLAHASYSPDAGFATTALNALKPVNRVVYVPNGSGLTPGWFAGIYDDGVVVVVSGTTNYRQSLNYILSHANDMQGGSGWTVNKAWWDAAAAILPLLAPLIASPTTPILFIGHSYGAAVAATLLAQQQNLNRELGLALITYGAPAYSNDAFNNVIRFVDVVRVVNDNDPVPYLPPPALVGYGLNSSPAFRLNPGAYAHNRPPQIVRLGGNYSLGAYNEQSTAQWFQQLARFMSDSGNAVADHIMGRYAYLAQPAQGRQPGSYLEDWAGWFNLAAANQQMNNAGF